MLIVPILDILSIVKKKASFERTFWNASIVLSH